MRRPAVVVAVAVIVIGLAVAAPAYLTRKRDYVAVTPQAPTFKPNKPVVFRLQGDSTACMDLVAVDGHSEQARLQAMTRGSSALPLELTVTGPGYRTQGRVGARYADGQTVAVAIRPPRRSLVATACVRNRGPGTVDLAGVGDRSRSRSTITVNGTRAGSTRAGYTSGVGFVLTFYERRPASILSRLPVSLQRMSVLRPGVVVPATLWPLLALFVVGMPALAVWAFARALSADQAEEEERTA